MLVALALASAAVGDTLPRPITLEEAVALAKQNAPQMMQAVGRRRTSAAGVRSAWATFLPSATLSAGTSRQVPTSGSRTRLENGQIITLPDQPWSYNVGFGASVDLFDGGRRLFGLRQAESQAEAARADEVSQSFSTALAAKQSFFDVLAARESEAAAAAQLAQAQLQLEASAARLKVHAVTRSDSLRSAIQVRAARIAVLDARNGLDYANAALTRVVGADRPVTAAAGDRGVDQPLALDDAALAALAEDGPAVRSAKAAADAARAARRAAYGSYLPSLSTSYSRSGSGVGDALLPSGDPFSSSGSVRLSLSLPLFNQLQREQQVVAARVAEENAVATLRDARLAARAGLVQLLGAYRTAEEKVASQTATLAASEEDLRVQQQRYASGGSTQLDVLTSQTQLDQARRDLIRARYDLRIARAQLEALVGREL
jgi:outer membrane protein